MQDDGALERAGFKGAVSLPRGSGSKFDVVAQCKSAAEAALL